jgi:hypothetical protein
MSWSINFDVVQINEYVLHSIFLLKSFVFDLM